MRRVLTTGALLMAVGATAALAATPARVRVNPRTGRAHTRFLVSFTAPAASGSGSRTVVHYLVDAELSRTKHGRCDSAVSVAVASARKGQRVRVGLRPAGHWCSGRFAGAVRETITPQCAQGQLCPLYIAQVVIGRFAFRVR